MHALFQKNFNNSGHINDDNSDKTQRNMQNTGHANYMLNNFMISDLPINNTIDTALDQPIINYRGTHGLSIGGSNVDINSELTIGAVQNKQRERNQLNSRIFNTIPFMGRGKVDTDVETAIMQSGDLSEKKSEMAMSEKDYTNVRNYPLISSIEETVSNPNNLVEEAAHSGWTRGGVPSRSMSQVN